MGHVPVRYVSHNQRVSWHITGLTMVYDRYNYSECGLQIHWIGLRDKLLETPIFHRKNHSFRLRFSLKPIQWKMKENGFVRTEGIPTTSQLGEIVIIHWNREHPIFRQSQMVNGHVRNLDWRYLPYIRPIFQAEFSGNTPAKYGQKYGTNVPAF